MTWITAIIAFLVALIAWGQWQVARNKLRLDLFDRRFKVFDATRKFVASIVRDAKRLDEELFLFYGATSDATFLFGSDVETYLTEIRKRACDMELSQNLCSPLPVGEERNRHSQDCHEHLLWFGRQHDAMPNFSHLTWDFRKLN